MALATSGQLTLGEIAEEFGGSAPHALSEYYAGGDNVAAGAQNGGGQALPTSGEIKISDFYGAQSFGSYTLQYYVIGGGGTGGGISKAEMEMLLAKASIPSQTIRIEQAPLKITTDEKYKM